MKKLRTFGLILFALSTSTPSWASFYIGAGIGPDTVNFSKHATVNNPDTRVLDNESLAGRGVFVTAFGGYAWNCQQLYLAGEANVNSSSLESESANIELLHHTVSHTAIKIKHNFGLSILPGFLLTDKTLFYGRIGWVQGYLKINSSDSTLRNSSTTLNGYRLGLGVEQTVYNRFAVRLEWSQLNYDDTTINVLDGTTRKISNIWARTNQFEFGVDYRFC